MSKRKEEKQEKNFYVTNKEILNEFEKYWDSGKISDRFVDIIYCLARKNASSRNFQYYTYLEDMIQEAVFHVLNSGLNNFKRGETNPFAYLTTIIRYKFIEYIKKEKKNIHLKENLIKQLKEEIKDNIYHRND